MNSVKLIIGSIVRTGIAFLCGVLVAKGLIDSKLATDEVIGAIAIGVTGVVFTLAASLWQKAVAKWKFLEALDMHQTNPRDGSAAVEATAAATPPAAKIDALLKK